MTKSSENRLGRMVSLNQATNIVIQNLINKQPEIVEALNEKLSA